MPKCRCCCGGPLFDGARYFTIVAFNSDGTRRWRADHHNDESPASDVERSGALLFVPSGVAGEDTLFDVGSLLSTGKGVMQRWSNITAAAPSRQWFGAGTGSNETALGQYARGTLRDRAKLAYCPADDAIWAMQTNPSNVQTLVARWASGGVSINSLSQTNLRASDIPRGRAEQEIRIAGTSAVVSGGSPGSTFPFLYRYSSALGFEDQQLPPGSGTPQSDSITLVPAGGWGIRNQNGANVALATYDDSIVVTSTASSTTVSTSAGGTPRAIADPTAQIVYFYETDHHIRGRDTTNLSSIITDFVGPSSLPYNLIHADAAGYIYAARNSVFNPIVKIDPSDGTEVWTSETFPGVICGMRQKGENLIVWGWWRRSPGGTPDPFYYHVAELDASDGSTTWEASYTTHLHGNSNANVGTGFADTIGFNIVQDVQIGSDESVYVCGRRYRIGNPDVPTSDLN